MHAASRFLIAAILAGVTSHTWADDDEPYRQHDAHVHGVASLDIAFEGGGIVAELTSPAMNIVGFEHAPRTAEHHELLDSAAASLAAAESWLILPPAAGCRIESADVESSLLEDDESAGPDQDGTHEHHAHDEDHEEHHDQVHSQFRVRHRFQCDNPDGIQSVTVRLFDEFPGMERIQLQVLTDTRQIGGALLPDDNVIDLTEE